MAFPLSQDVVLGVGADVAYIDEVGSVFNPSSGDQVFVDGLSTRLTTTDMLSYKVGLVVRFAF